MMNNTRVQDRLKIYLVEDGRRRLVRETYTGTPWQKFRKFIGLGNCYCNDIIVDTGLARIAYLVMGDFDYMSAGTGTTIPESTDTTLEAEALTRALMTKQQLTTFYTNDTIRFTGTFSSTSDVVLTECGLHTNSTAGSGDIMLARETYQAITKPAGVDITFDWDIVFVR